MDDHLTAERKAFQKKLYDFVQTEVKKAVSQMEKEDRFPIKLVRKMGEAGFMGIPIPEKYGGLGLDLRAYIQAIYEISKVSAAAGVILSVHTSVGTNPIFYFGNEQQKATYLPKLASGIYLGAFALTEPGSGSDAQGMKSRAEKKHEHYILNGSKVFITNGGMADTYITFARTGKNLKEISAFIVEKDAPGLIIGKNEKKMGLKGASTVPLTFDNCIVPKENLLGKEGDGFPIAMRNLNIGRIGIAAQALGIAEAALEHSILFMKEQNIQDNQGLSFKLAEMAVETEAAKRLIEHTTSLIEKGKPSRKEVSIAKLFAAKTAVYAASEAMQIVGYNGFRHGSTVERFFRDAKVTEIYEGTNEIQKMVIAKQLLQRNE